MCGSKISRCLSLTDTNTPITSACPICRHSRYDTCWSNTSPTVLPMLLSSASIRVPKRPRSILNRTTTNFHLTFIKWRTYTVFSDRPLPTSPTSMHTTSRWTTSHWDFASISSRTTKATEWTRHIFGKRRHGEFLSMHLCRGEGDKHHSFSQHADGAND